MTKSILSSVLPAARNAARIFGFTRSKWNSPYLTIEYKGAVYSIVSKALPNDFARIDIVLVDDKPVGSVLFVEISSHVLHMVGMFIKEEHRGKRISYIYDNKEKDVTIASFLLDHVMESLVTKNVQVTLEVMNYNESAYKLYERTSTFTNSSMPPQQFELCSRSDVLEYKKIRRKVVKRWHDIGFGEDKLGVQWAHVPDYNGVATWSIARVYCWKKSYESLRGGYITFVKNRLKLIYSVLKYGSIFRFTYYFLLKKITILKR